MFNKIKKISKNILSKNTKIYKISRKIYYIFQKYFVSTTSKIIKNYLLIKYLKRNFLKRKINSTESCGFLYIAFGENFYREALKSAEILKKETNLPIHIFTDQKQISDYELQVFTSIEKVPGTHKRSKVDFIHMSPFEKTIYLDSDIVVVGNIDDLFELLDKFDVLATLDTARKRENISKIIKIYSEIPYAFGEVNGGLLGFNKYARDKIFRFWPKLFYKYMIETKGWDQPTLRILLWKYQNSIYLLPPEYNVRSSALLKKVRENKNLFGVNHMKPRIYHMHANKEINKGIYEDYSSDEIIEIVKERAYEIIY